MKKHIDQDQQMEEFGEQVRMFRAKHRLTVSEFARKSGVSTTSIGHIETGKVKKTFNIDTLAKIAEAMDNDLIIKLIPRSA